MHVSAENCSELLVVAPTVAVVVVGPVAVVSDGCEVLRSALTVCVVLRVAGTSWQASA